MKNNNYISFTSVFLKKQKYNIVKIVGILLFFILWELYGRSVGPLFISYPTAIFYAFIENINEIMNSFADTSLIFIYGMLISIPIGVLLGIFLALNKFLDAILDPFVNALYSTPRIVFVSLIILWFGLGIKGKVFMVVLLAIFPVIINTYHGIKNINPAYKDLAKIFKLNRIQKLRFILIPSTLPFIWSGIRLAIGLGIIGVILSEMFIGLSGLGGLVVTYTSRFQIDKAFAVILVIAAVGILLITLMRIISKRYFPWIEGEFEKEITIK